MKKIIGKGLLTGLVMLLVGMAINMAMNILVPSLAAEYKNSGLFRPWSDPLMSLFFLYPFLAGIILAWIWSKVKDLLRGETAAKKGFNYGIIYWITSLPGMLITYSSFTVSLAMVASWSIGGLLQAICAGILLAKIMK